MTYSQTGFVDGTRVSLSVSGCQGIQAELDQLADKVLQEVSTKQRPNMRLEQMVKLLQMEKAAFEQSLAKLLATAQIDSTSPIHFRLNQQQLQMVEQSTIHPHAREINYLFAQAPKLAHDFAHLEQHVRAIEMGRIATAAYGDWKQHQDPTAVRNITRTAMYQLQNMSGACFQHKKLTLILEGQAQRQLSFNRRFSFA